MRPQSRNKQIERDQTGTYDHYTLGVPANFLKEAAKRFIN